MTSLGSTTSRLWLVALLCGVLLAANAMGKTLPPEPAAAKTPPSDPLSDSLVSVRVVGGFTPYRLTTYEVMWRARVAVSGHYRGLVNYGEALHQMSLVPKAEYLALLRRLKGLGVFELDRAPVVDRELKSQLGALKYEIEVGDGSKHTLIKLTAPHAQQDGRYLAVIEAVREFVIKTAGDLAFRNVFFEPGTFGYVNLTSVPTARVWVDGRDTKRDTPLYGYELPAGKHAIKMVALKEKWERKHTLTVEPGMTTIVHFDLR
ncbi:MAG: hypothetical protein ACI9OJ_002714 [Myxococcota bacterium]|jgi:hypothetical protein